jgi:CheY-like chemotaxis protein
MSGQKAKTVLLIDDEAVIRDVGSEMLKRLGFSVVTASDGAGALDTFRRNRETVDLVILDLMLPDMTGSQVFDGIRSADPEAKVLLSSGYAAEGEAAGILERGCKGFIQKPFNLQRLSDTIAGVLGP